MTDAYSRIFAWLKSMAPEGVTFMVQNANIPAPPRPYITVKISATAEYGFDRTGVDDEGLQQHTRFHAMTVSLQIYGAPVTHPEGVPESETIAQSIMDNVYNYDSALEYLGRTIAFNNVLLGPQTVDAVIGTEWEPRVVLDLGMSATRDTLYDVGVIENVEYAGNIGGVEVTGEVTT